MSIVGALWRLQSRLACPTVHGCGTALCRTRAASTVAIGISGGVDSSVSALLLKQAGHNVIGVHMKNWDESDERGEAVCPETEDLKYARAVCDQLDIPLHSVDLVQEYWTDVFEPFLQAYSEGITPNPDVGCNRYIKFGAFQKHCVQKLGVDYVATGHYCRVQHQPGGRSLLLRGRDRHKDQSYFLSGVKEPALRRALFPIGHLEKPEVRALAQQHGLATAKRPDSYGICFIGKRKLGEFLPNYIPITKGYWQDIDSKEVLGEHGGAELFTLGQNARIPGKDRRWFVVGVDVKSGRVDVAWDSNHPALYCDTIEVDAAKFNWIVPCPIGVGGSFRCRYRVRYRQDEMGYCKVSMPEQGRLVVTFEKAQRAATPGQVVALYGEDSDVCLGGGMIEHLGPTYFDQGRPSPGADDRLN